MATSACLVTAGCADEELDTGLDTEYDDTDLKDDDGNEYALHKNSDGTETAKYKDGREVTFRRDENNNLNYVSGAAGLLGGLAAGYFLFHGLNHGGGGYISNGAYHPSSSISRMTRDERDKKLRGGGYVPATSHSSTSAPAAPKSSVSSSSSSSKSSGSSVSSSSSSKGGFGGAGARSAAS